MKVKAFSIWTVLLLIGSLGLITFFGMTMGFANFFSTIMKTSHDLLLNTVFFIMALSVLAGAIGGFMAEFGILALLNWILAPVIRLFWGLPGAAAVGAISTFISDNPAIIALGKDKEFIRYFQEYQKPALTNFGTSFGMGLIVIAFMMSLGHFGAALIGFLGAIIGSIVSTRLMLMFSKKALGENGKDKSFSKEFDPKEFLKYREIKDGNLFHRFLESLLDGGKNGLEIGFQIIPGVLVICTMVLMVTMDGGAGYDGSAYQGVPLLSYVGKFLAKPMEWLFGFTSPDAIAYPITSLGAVGAALALVPRFLEQNLIGGNDIAVFTAIGMCWSGFLSTHIAMMKVLGFGKLTPKAMLSHTIGGLIAGISAHYLYVLISFLF